MYVIEDQEIGEFL